MIWRIRRRQSTFWDFESSEGTQRVHFIGKLEHHFVSNYADGLEINDVHPVLVNYQNAWTDVYISTKPQRPGEVAIDLLRVVQAEAGDWRSPADYFNRNVEPRVLLEKGIGLIFSGPEPLYLVVAEALGAAGVSFTAIPQKHVEQHARALVAGKNFVVAKGFRYEA